MHIISSFIFAFSVNIDAFLVGMSYGIRKIHITLLQNLLISLISFAGTFLSLFAGCQLLAFLPALLGDYLGSGILFALGGFYIIKSFSRQVNSLHAEQLRITLPLKETLLLGAALSLNNIGIGIGVGISGITLMPAAVITFLTALLLLPAGNHLGNASLFRLSSRYADLLSGSMLLILGLCNFLF